MNIVVTGETGRLGKHLVDHHGCVPFGWMSTNESAIRRRIYELGHPEVIIHCAAVTDVDGCESGELFDKALMTNWYRTRALRRMYSGRIIYISTDYVFDGENGPYDEWGVPNPINHYGYTKMCGERVMFDGSGDFCIIRTTQLFGGEKEDFVSRMIDHLKNGEWWLYSAKLLGSPTFIPDLSIALMELVEKQSAPNVLNIAGDRVISRYRFALAVADTLHLDKSLIHASKSTLSIAYKPISAGLIVNDAINLGFTIRDPLLGVMEKYL